MQRRECLSSLLRGKRLILFADESVSLFSMERGETHSRCRAESVSVLYRDDGILRFFAEESVSLLHSEDRTLLRFAEERVSLFFIESGTLLYRDDVRFLLFA